MIVLERKMSNKQLKLAAIVRRLDPESVEYEHYKNQYILAKHGYEGELRVDREWKEIYIPTNYYLFHNYETVNEANHSHQIDTIFACSHFILLLEIKNIGGRIDFDQTKHQFMRTRLDGTKESFSNPIDQIERHVRFFQRNLKKWDIALPIAYAVILTQPSTIIGEVPEHVSIFHVSGLQSYVYRLFHKHRVNQVDQAQLDRMRSNLLRMRKSKIWNPNIDVRSLRKGALCEVCHYQSMMQFNYGRFVCPVCQVKSKTVLYEALHDYRYLFKDTITNSEAREFFGIDSRFAANRLLVDLNVEFEGKFRDRKYKIPEDILDRKLKSHVNRGKSLVN